MAILTRRPLRDVRERFVPAPPPRRGMRTPQTGPARWFTQPRALRGVPR